MIKTQNQRKGLPQKSHHRDATRVSEKTQTLYILISGASNQESKVDDEK